MILNESIGRQNNTPKFPNSFRIDKKIVTNKTEITDEFNKYFPMIGLSTSESQKKI